MVHGCGWKFLCHRSMGSDIDVLLLKDAKKGCMAVLLECVIAILSTDWA